MEEQVFNNISNKVFSRFVKDFNLPIQVTDSRYIMYYLKLYDKVYNSMYFYNLFEKYYMEVGGTNEAFLTEYYKVVDNAIEIVKGTPSYKEFIGNTSNMFNRKKEDWFCQNIPNKNVYHPSSEGKTFFSVDLVKGNYSALKYYSQEIKQEADTKDNLILGSHNFEEFISLFSDNEYFKKSKHLRQVIFGNMNPKRQVTIEKVMIDNLAKVLVEKGLFKKEDIHSVNNDELIFSLAEKKENLEENVKAVAKELNIDIHTETFSIKQIKPLDSFVKIKEDKTIELKCVDSSLMAQVYKHVMKDFLNNKEIIQQDLMFKASNGLLAYFAEPITFEEDFTF